jgi:hypothetical protein
MSAIILRTLIIQFFGIFETCGKCDAAPGRAGWQCTEPAVICSEDDLLDRRVRLERFGCFSENLCNSVFGSDEPKGGRDEIVKITRPLERRPNLHIRQRVFFDMEV